MSSFLSYDAALVYALQRSLAHFTILPPLATLASTIGDPRYSYTIVFPAVYWLLGPRAGVHVLLVSAVAEWVNITLKWLLLGDRPYWWVEGVWPPEKELLQFPFTCETGPGNPSGHVMVTLSVLLTALHHLDVSHASHVICLLHVGVWLLTAAIGLSRVLASTHFIHQVALGYVTGLIIHRLALHLNLTLTRSNARGYALISTSMLLAGLSIYHIWTWLGFDPSFSVDKAIRACKEGSWIHLDTTPFYSLVRSSGSVLGLGLVARTCSSLWSSYSLSLTRRMSGLFLSLVLVAVISSLPVPLNNTVVFYITSMIKCGLFPISIAVVKMLYCVV